MSKARKALSIISTFALVMTMNIVVTPKLSAPVSAALPVGVTISGNPGDLTAVAMGDFYNMNDGKNSRTITGDTWMNSWDSQGNS